MRPRLVAVWMMMSLGCGRYGFESRRADDGGTNDTGVAGDAIQSCQVWGPFGPAIDVSQFDGGNEELDPSFAGDTSQLWYVRANLGWDIYVVTRNASGIYGGETASPFNAATDETDPQLTTDGLNIFFVSSRPTIRLYEARRVSLAQSFGPASLAVGLETTAVESADATGDGLAVFFSSGSDMFSATRPDRSSAFGAPVALGFTGDYPSVSQDGRELYFQRGSNLFMRTRATETDVFANEVQLMSLSPMFNGDVEITKDGTELWFDDFSNTLYKKTRTCAG